MALTQRDLQQIQNLLSTQLSAQDLRIRLDLREALTQQAQDIKRDIRDEMDARFVAFEHKMDRRFEGLRIEFRQEIKAVIDILLTFIPERFEKLEHDMTRVKAHIGLA